MASYVARVPDYSGTRFAATGRSLRARGRIAGLCPRDVRESPKKGHSGASRSACCAVTQSVCFMHCALVARQGMTERMTTRMRRAMRKHSRARRARIREENPLVIVTLYEAALAAAVADWRTVRIGPSCRFVAWYVTLSNGARDGATIGRAPRRVLVE